jgi:hypothetical protein
MNAFKYGIGEPGRPIASEFTPESRPMFRNAMTRVDPRNKSFFLKEYFSYTDPEKAEAFAKIFQALPKVVYTRRRPHYFKLNAKPTLLPIPETKQLRKRTRKQRSRKNRR